MFLLGQQQCSHELLLPLASSSNRSMCARLEEFPHGLVTWCRAQYNLAQRTYRRTSLHSIQAQENQEFGKRQSPASAASPTERGHARNFT